MDIEEENPSIDLRSCNFKHKNAYTKSRRRLQSFVSFSIRISCDIVAQPRMRRICTSFLSLKYLHDSGFIHRNIKCANTLVDANGSVKLADFGLLKVSKLNDLKSCKGPPHWMAPESKYNDEYESPADIWSLGCTVLEMLTGQIPYFNMEPVGVLFKIRTGKLPEIPDTLLLDTRNFILKCLKVNPDERPTAAELLNHPFVRRPLLFRKDFVVVYDDNLIFYFLFLENGYIVSLPKNTVA